MESRKESRRKYTGQLLGRVITRFAEGKVPLPQSEIKSDFGTFGRRRHITKARYQSVDMRLTDAREFYEC
jgi:hypothetical protein